MNIRVRETLKTNNIPCKDCISFAICKASYNKDEIDPYNFRGRLTEKCSLIVTYLYKCYTRNLYLSERVEKLHETFNIYQDRYIGVN